MSGGTILLILVITLAFIICVASILINSGYQKDQEGRRNAKLIAIGWIIIGTSSFSGTVLFILIALWTGYLYGLGLLAIPLLILAGLVASLTVGISNLAKGYAKDANGKRNHSLISSGWILLAINLTILVSIITLLVLFATGGIPIALM